MDFIKEEEFIRHNCFREELYVYAHLPQKEFKIILDEFKKRMPHFVSSEKKRPLDISWNQFRKQVERFFS